MKEDNASVIARPVIRSFLRCRMQVGPVVGVVVLVTIVLTGTWAFWCARSASHAVTVGGFLAMLVAFFLVELVGCSRVHWLFFRDSLVGALLALVGGMVACGLARLFATFIAPIDEAWYQEKSLFQFVRDSGSPWMAWGNLLVLACTLSMAINGWCLAEVFGNNIETYLRQQDPFELNVTVAWHVDREWGFAGRAWLVLGPVFGGMLGALLGAFVFSILGMRALWRIRSEPAMPPSA